MRFAVPIIVVAFLFGCSRSPSPQMKPPLNLPANADDIHPWMGELIDKQPEEIKQAVAQRLASFPEELTPFTKHIESYTPTRLAFHRIRSGHIGYVMCVRKSSPNQTVFSTGEFLLLGEPLPDSTIDKFASFYDPSIRDMMRCFWSVAGYVGDEMVGTSGAFGSHGLASEIAYYERVKLGEWSDSRELYRGRNGDSVFVNPVGGTVWHQFETGKIIPLFDDFPKFVEHWGAVRDAKLDFNSWDSLELLKRNP